MQLLSKDGIKKAATYGIGQVVNLISPLLITPFIVYRCGEEGLGKVGISIAIMFILAVIVDYGSYVIGVKEVSISRNDPARLRTIFTEIYTLKTVLLLAVVVVFSLSVLSIPYLFAERKLFFLALLVLIGQYVNPTWFLQGIENFKWISIINIVAKLLYVAFVLLLVRGKSDYVLVNGFLGIGSIIANLIGVGWIVKSYQIQTFSIDFNRLKTNLQNDYKFCISQLFLAFRQYIPILIVGYMCNSFVAGQYRIIEQIIMLFRTYMQVFFRFIYSSVCFNINSDFASGIKLWKKNNLISLGLITILVAILFILAPYVLMYFKIQENHLESMSLLLRIALVIPIIMGFSNALEQLLFVFDKNKVYINLTIAFTIVNLILLLIGVRLFDITGIIYAIILTETVLFFGYCFSVKDVFQKKMNDANT